MSTFPTAFWKTKRATSVGVGTSISWETGSWWSYGNGSPALQNFPLKQDSNFPFGVYVPSFDAIDEYYTEYDNVSYAEKKADSTYSYYGWFLQGGEDLSEENVDLSAWHNAEPWEVGADGLNLSVQNETDFTTSYTSGYYNDTDNYGQVFSDKTFNKFIQSGEATGSFTLNTTSTLTIKVSGLGNDTSHEWEFGSTIEDQDANYPGDKSIFSNSMVLSLYNANTSSDTIICSGKAPMDDRLLSNTDLKNQQDLIGMDLDYNIDMQQVKLYNAGSSTIANTTAGTKGEPRGDSSNWVDQGNRIDGGYTTTNGIGTFTQNSLAAGNYEIRIKASTYDVEYNSGAFYGFTFSFS
jgi:hypothetical protein